MFSRFQYVLLLVTVGVFLSAMGAARGEDALTIIATVNSKTNEAELEKELVFAIKQIPGVDPNATFNVSSQALSSNGFTALQFLFEDIASEGLQKSFDDENFGLTLSSNQQWIIEDNSPQAPRWDALEVIYEDKAGATKTEVFEVGAKGDETPFRATSLSESVFTPLDSWNLKTFRLRDAKTQKFSDVFKFPRQDRHLIIRIKTDAKVSFDLLYETLLNSDKVGTRIKDIRRPKSATLVLANFEYVIPPEGVVFDETTNTATITANPLVGVGTCKRVWMLFPLTTEEKDAAMKDLKDRGLLADVFSFDEALRKGEYKSKSGSVEQYDTFKSSYADDGPSILLPSDAPKWYELVPVNAAGEVTANKDVAKYQRVFQIEDIPGWKEKYRGKDTDTWRILAYEFEGQDGGAKMLRVQRDVDGEEEVALDGQVPGWPIGLGLKK